MNEESVDKAAIIQKFQNIIQLATGTENNFTLVVVLEKIHRLKSWPLFTVSVGPDEQEGDNNIIKVW
jgi:hypothetical protein